MDKKFYPTIYSGCNYLSMIGLELIHASKRGQRNQNFYKFDTIVADDPVTLRGRALAVTIFTSFARIYPGHWQVLIYQSVLKLIAEK